jgi:hypothetical protein
MTLFTNTSLPVSVPTPPFPPQAVQPNNPPSTFCLSYPPTYTPVSDSDDEYEPLQHHVCPLFSTPTNDAEVEFPIAAAHEATPPAVALAASHAEDHLDASDQGQLLPRPPPRLYQPTYRQKKYQKVGDIDAIVQGSYLFPG